MGFTQIFDEAIRCIAQYILPDVFSPLRRENKESPAGFPTGLSDTESLKKWRPNRRDNHRHPACGD